MFTIAPRPRSIIPGSTTREQRKTLFRTTSTSRSQVGSSIARTSSPSAMAALLTSTSTGPRSDRTAANIDSTCGPELTSAVTGSAPGSSRATACARSACQSTTPTLAPSAAKRPAMTRPIPEPAPVMTTTFPPNRILLSTSRLRGAAAESPQRRQHDPARVGRVMEHGLDRDLTVGKPVHAYRIARVQVPVPVRKVARADLDANPVTPFENVAAGADVHHELAHFAGRNRPRAVGPAGEAGALG